MWKKIFLIFFDEIRCDNDRYAAYRIKDKLLLEHLKSFFFEFHSLIESDERLYYFDEFDREYDNIIQRKDVAALLNHFDDPKAGLPEYYKQSQGAFSPAVGIVPDEYLRIYSGSYKAMLEVYSTLKHLRKLLIKAVDNPLARVTIFGMFG